MPHSDNRHIRISNRVTSKALCAAALLPAAFNRLLFDHPQKGLSLRPHTAHTLRTHAQSATCVDNLSLSTRAAAARKSRLRVELSSMHVRTAVGPLAKEIWPLVAQPPL